MTRHAKLVAQWRQRRLNRLLCETHALALASTEAWICGHPNAADAELKARDRYRRVMQQLQLIKDKAQ